MDKQHIAVLKKNFPRLFRSLVRFPLLTWMATELDRGRYMYCRMTRTPYFGTCYLAGQTWHERKAYMRRCIAQELQLKPEGGFQLLEIGSWAGDSAVLWATAINASDPKGQVHCVDAWAPYINEQKERGHTAAILMNRALKKNKIFDLFQHNIRSSGLAHVIHPIRGSSADVLPALKPKLFDMIYIDGDHSYSGISRDLHLASHLLKEGGVMAGDDLDMDVNDFDLAHARDNREANTVKDPRTGQFYHPGVCLAVTEFFGRPVACYEGFWAMRKTASGFVPVQL